MKQIIFFLTLITGTCSFTQDTTKARPCNQLPIAGAEKKAIFDGEIEKFFSQNLPNDLKKGSHSAVFKLLVDCYGIPSKPIYQTGTLNESNQKYFLDLLLTTKWKPAVDKFADVTTFVFITLEIVNGQVTVVVQ